MERTYPKKMEDHGSSTDYLVNTYGDESHPRHEQTGMRRKEGFYNGNKDDYDRKSKNPIKAKNGFHGYVDHPMHFLAGEAGRERIDIHKTKRKHHDNFWDVSEYFGGKY